MTGSRGGTEEPKVFSFDHIFDQADAQADVYAALGPPVLQMLQRGHNASVFAYGQTGSGKTYTMLGTEEAPGLVPRLCESLFDPSQFGAAWGVTLSFFEVYNEQVVDLLSAPDDAAERDRQTPWQNDLAPVRRLPVIAALRVRDHPKLGVLIEGLTKLTVTSPGEVVAALARGTALRSVAETVMNAESSRSHAVVQLSLDEGARGDRTAVLNLVDLAGSENVGRSRSNEDESRLKETRSINKSLLGLGKCITMLAQGAGASGGPLVPYRDSTLTWLLKEALGGNAHTLMVCAVDPSVDNAEQTLTTLRYADQAKRIVTRPMENIDFAKREVRELQEQIASLRTEAATAEEAAARAVRQADAHALQSKESQQQAQAAATAAKQQARAMRAEAEAAAAAAAAAVAEAASRREESMALATAARQAEGESEAEAARWRQLAAEREEGAQALLALLAHPSSTPDC